jgi:hypothetical protein
MSNTLDVGPIQIMKRAMEAAFQDFGPARYSGSTLSLYNFNPSGQKIRNEVSERIADQGIVA